jgi:replicative DNA helicase
LGRLRDSGQIAEAADVVILIYRPEVNNKSYPNDFSNVDTKGTAMIDIAKGRNIGLLRFICGFNAATTCFYNRDYVPLLGGKQSGAEDDNPF